VNCLDWSDNGTLLASGSDDRKIAIYNFYSDKKVYFYYILFCKVFNHHFEADYSWHSTLAKHIWGKIFSRKCKLQRVKILKVIIFFFFSVSIE
jgi:WD40 repeat protein